MLTHGKSSVDEIDGLREYYVRKKKEIKSNSKNQQRGFVCKSGMHRS